MPDKTTVKHAYTIGSTDTESSSPANVEGIVEDIPYRLLRDGSRLYNWKIARGSDPFSTQFHDVMVFGRSVLHLGVEEVRVYPNGWGYALVQKLEESDEVYTLPDGRALNHYLHGYIEIV